MIQNLQGAEGLASLLRKVHKNQLCAKMTLMVKSSKLEKHAELAKSLHWFYQSSTL